MQKGKATASPTAMVFQGRPPQQNPRGPPTSQQRPEDFNPRQAQTYQIQGQLPQNLVMQAMPGQMPGSQGQARLQGPPFYHGQRPIRVPRQPPPSNQPMYSSPPGGPMVQMIGPGPGPAQFIPPGQPGPFLPQHVDFPIHMGGPPPYRPQQAMQGQFPPGSGPSQPQGPYMYQPPAGYPMGQPAPPVYIVRAPAAPMTGMPQYQPQTFEPRAREKKIIQIKDPNSNKDVTQEILNRTPGGSSTATTVGTPNSITPDLSGQSSSSSTPPLTAQQQAEADVRAQFAAQVAATLDNNPEVRPRKPEYTIQKSTANSRAEIGSVKVKEPVDVQKDEDPNKNDAINNVTDKQLAEKARETQTKEATVTVKSQPKEAVQGPKLNEGGSGENVLGSKSLVSSVDATTSANEKIPNVRVEIFTAEEVRNEELLKSSTGVVSDVVKTEEKVPESPETEKEVAIDLSPTPDSKTLNGPVTIPEDVAQEETEEVITVDSQAEVEAPPMSAAQTPEPSKAGEGEQVAEPEKTSQEAEEPEVLPSSSEVAEEAVGIEKVNGHEGDRKVSAGVKNPPDTQVPVAPSKDMKKKKQKQRIKEMEKRSSEKGTDLMEAYTEKPVQEKVSGDNEEQPAEETMQTQQEEAAEEPQSEDETWEDKEESWSPELEGVSDSRPDGAKLTYGRDFLLQFQTNPLCMTKPEGLPDLEVVLLQARTPSKPGFQQNRGQKGDGGENMFLPAYIKQRSNPTGSRGVRRNVQPKKVIEFPSVQPQTDLKRSENRWMRPSELSKSGNEEQLKTEELYRKVRSILNKLTPQKFQTLTQQIIDLDIDTPERLEGAIDLIFEKAIDEAAFSVAYANMCRSLVNKKVVVEKEGAKKDVSFRKILLNKCQKEFEREKTLEKTIQEKLEDLTKQGLSEEVLQSKKRDLQDEEHLAKRRTLGNIRFIGELFKLKMLTENIMHDCVVKLLKSNDEESFECLCKLLVTIGKDLDHAKAKPRVDQYFAQINKIIQARITSSRVRFMMQDIVDLRNNNWVPRREDNNPKTIDQIEKEAADQAKQKQIMIQMAKQDKRSQRGNMGGRDSPRPGTIPQADESWTMVSRGARNVSVDPKKFQNIKRPVDSENISLGPGGRGYGVWARGSSGGTGAVGAGAGPSAAGAGSAGSSTAGSSAETDNRPVNRFSALAGDRKLSAPGRSSSGDSRRQEPRSPISGGGRRGPFPQGEREKAVEAVRAAMQPKRGSQERDGGRESPRTTAEAAASTDSDALAGPAAPPAVQEVTIETMKKKTFSIIDEFLDIRDMKEAAECLKELESPSRHHVFVEVTLNHTMEKRESQRQATGKLFHFLMRDGVLTAQQYLRGLDPMLENAGDLEIDIPQLWKYLGELMGPTAFDGNLSLQELVKCVLKHVSKHKAAKLFASMLNSSGKSQEDIGVFLKKYKVDLNTFFDDEEEAREFAKDKNIEFALGKAAPSSQHSARIQEELRTLILKRKARNEEVMDWIDKEVSFADRKEPSFIRALVTVVCEGAMNKEDGGVCKCNLDKLKDRKSLLQKYIDTNTSLELQALYAVQALFVDLDHPPGFIKSYFDSLYDEEIITEESFHTWESSTDAEPGKGVTVKAASEFFRWLRSAPEETSEGS